MVDQQNANLGNLDSAALLIGSSGVGIFSNRNTAISNYAGLDFWTGNLRRLTISNGGFVGVGLGASTSLYPLDDNGTIQSRGNLRSDNSVIAENNVLAGVI